NAIVQDLRSFSHVDRVVVTAQHCAKPHARMYAQANTADYHCRFGDPVGTFRRQLWCNAAKLKDRHPSPPEMPNMKADRPVRAEQLDVCTPILSRFTIPAGTK